MKAEVFEGMWADRRDFHQRSVEAFNAFARELRITLFEREEAFTSPGGLGLALESNTIEYGVNVNVVLSESLSENSNRVSCRFRILTLKKGSEMITWVDLQKVLYVDPNRPETITTLVTTILENLQKALLPDEAPEENVAHVPRLELVESHARRIL